MEPNPSVYLRAIRREALSEDLLGAGLSSGASQVIMQRGAEVLAQLIVRRERVPALLREHFPSQLTALLAVEARLLARAAPLPAPLAAAIEFLRSLPSTPGEGDIVLYDASVQGLAAGIRALREQSAHAAADSAWLGGLCGELCAREVALRDRLEAEVESVRAERDRATTSPALAAPTEDALTSYLRERLPECPALDVANVQRLVGDNSKEIFFFDVRDAGTLSGAYVMRREPAYNVTEAVLADEAPLIRHLHQAGLPVPRVLVGEADARRFGGGFIITERLPGATRPPAQYGTAAHDIMKDLARTLAAIHAVPIDPRLPQCADAGRTAADRMRTRVRHMYQRWVRERSEDSVIIESAYQWLETNAEQLDETVVLTHGDYSLRNVLLMGDSISAILDWELCCISHPAEDLSYVRPWVTPFLPWEEFLAAYLSRSRHTVSEFALLYFRVWANFWNVVIGASVYSGYHLGKHRNFVWVSVACVEYSTNLQRLAQLLSEVSQSHQLPISSRSPP